jgi:hypothetical protein
MLNLEQKFCGIPLKKFHLLGITYEYRSNEKFITNQNFLMIFKNPYFD